MAPSTRPSAVEHAARPPASDAEVLEAWRGGDRNGAVCLLMSAHGASVWSHCRRVLRDDDRAKDVHQQVFVEAGRDLDRYEGRSTLHTWLIGIANHRCRDAIRARRRRDARFVPEEEGTEVPAALPSPTEEIDRKRRLQYLEECLKALAAEVRTAVLLRFRGAMSYEEMADAVDAKAGTLQRRVERAFPVLRRCLQDKEMGHDPSGR